MHWFFFHFFRPTSKQLLWLLYCCVTVLGIGWGVLAYPYSASAQETPTIPIYVFSRDDCQHCKDQQSFLSTLAQQRNDFEVFEMDITSSEHAALWEEVTTGKKLPKATPITIINGRVLQGFDSAETTGRRITEMLNQAKNQEVVSLEAFVASSSAQVEQATGLCLESCEIEAEPLYVKVPFWGVIDVRPYSLPVLSAVLGFIDGFNPCAMWVLVSFLVILMQVGDKRKMWLFAGLFILAEAIMYFLILNVWSTTWDFIGMDAIVTPIVGVIAVGAGVFFLYEAWRGDGSCKVTHSEQKQNTRQKLKQLAESQLTWATIAGILLLAFSVNIIEFACSIGIPQAFTKILNLNGLNFWQSLPYNGIYILMYMIDDLVVFGIALYSFEKIGLTAKYTRASHIIGGVIMLMLGALLVFAPELLKVL